MFLIFPFFSRKAFNVGRTRTPSRIVLLETNLPRRQRPGTRIRPKRRLSMSDQSRLGSRPELSKLHPKGIGSSHALRGWHERSHGTQPNCAMVVYPDLVQI